jgi:hypothetical protein
MKSSNSVPSKSLFPTTYPEYVYNFAYGSNMHSNVLSGRRKIQPFESVPGVLEGWQLTFNLRGIPGIEPCFGNIQENSDSEIHGVLHKITGNDFKRLLATEGGGGVDENGYIPRIVNVHSYDGRIIEAFALVVRSMSPAILNRHAQPSARYMNLLRDGASHHKIHPLYIEYLQSLPSSERNTPMMILMIIGILLFIALCSPIWIPVLLYYFCTDQKVHGKAFFISFIMNNVWRIYYLHDIFKPVKPYYSAPFPIGSTNLKTNMSASNDAI